MEDLFFLIDSYEHTFTTVENVIAEYFLNKNKALTIDKLAKKISVSQSSITRFCRKIGLNNYKELIFLYDNSLQTTTNLNSSTSEIFNKYSSVFQEIKTNYSEKTIDKFCEYIHEYKIIHLIGRGFNNFVALDFQFRMYRLGKYVLPVSDENSIRLSLLQAESDELIIISSVGGEMNNRILKAVEDAKNRGVTVLLITANKNSPLVKYSEEIILTAQLTHSQSLGNISPQLPILVQIDIIYETYLHKYSKSVQQWIVTEQILNNLL